MTTSAGEREIRAELTELRAGLAELRLDWAERWSRSNDRLDDISRNLNMLIDLVASFRAEYNNHHHPHRHGDEGREEAA